jgi:hypothetical protein
MLGGQSRNASVPLHSMSTILIQVIATAINPPSVPDSGSTGILFGLGILATGLIARYLKNRKS